MSHTQNQINQIKQKAEIRQDKLSFFKQKTDNLINRDKLSYKDVGEIIDSLPFETNPMFRGALAKHIAAMKIYDLVLMVRKALDARAPERYFMKCLANQKDQIAGGAPQSGPTTILTENSGGVR